MLGAMNASHTARQRARAELTREIKEAARRQLAAVGAQQLSLRAVARELGMVSSAVYRYFPSRDDLLTALIIDAYDSIGEARGGPTPGRGPYHGRGGVRSAVRYGSGLLRTRMSTPLSMARPCPATGRP